MSRAKLTPNEQHVLAWIEQAEDSGALVIMGRDRTAWYGDLFVNWRTARSLAAKGLIVLDEPSNREDDVLIYMKGDER